MYIRPRTYMAAIAVCNRSMVDMMGLNVDIGRVNIPGREAVDKKEQTATEYTLDRNVEKEEQLCKARSVRMPSYREDLTFENEHENWRDCQR